VEVNYVCMCEEAQKIFSRFLKLTLIINPLWRGSNTNPFSEGFINNLPSLYTIMVTVDDIEPSNNIALDNTNNRLLPH
jgi:hypothetical protein